MTDLRNITKWCEEYSEKNGVKIFPQSAPILAIIDDVMSIILKHQLALVEISKAMMDINTQMKSILELAQPEPKVTKKEVKK